MKPSKIGRYKDMTNKEKYNQIEEHKDQVIEAIEKETLKFARRISELKEKYEETQSNRVEKLIFSNAKRFTQMITRLEKEYADLSEEQLKYY